MERIIGAKYKLGRKISGGSFGDIFLATHVDTLETVAVKIENSKTKHPRLLYEAKLYCILEGGSGIAGMKWFGVDGTENALVMDLLGPSLQDLFMFCGRKFSLKTVLLLADQMLIRIEYVHSKGYLHRDIEPENFLMGIGHKVNQVHLIDFGLAKIYRDPSNKSPIPYREKKKLTGIEEQGRRNDLESLGYVLLYFLRGSLPWEEGLEETVDKKHKYGKFCEKKISTPIEVLCKNQPVEFASYFHYCHTLTFDQSPDYGFLKRLFQDLFSREGYKYDYMFDWNIIHHQQAQKNGNQSQQAVPGSRNARAMAVYSSNHRADVIGPRSQINNNNNNTPTEKTHPVLKKVMMPASVVIQKSSTSISPAYTSEKKRQKAKVSSRFPQFMV